MCSLYVFIIIILLHMLFGFDRKKRLAAFKRDKEKENG